MWNLVVIGTAGRFKSEKLDRDLFWRAGHHLTRKVAALEAEYQTPVQLISGGSAWMDHLAVSLFLTRNPISLRLALPAPFNLEAGKFYPGSDGAGDRLNELHQRFSEAMGHETLLDIRDVLVNPQCHVSFHRGFFERNDEVASYAGSLVAYTSNGQTAVVSPGDPGYDNPKAFGLSEGGTAYTWRRANLMVEKAHVRLSDLYNEPV